MVERLQESGLGSFLISGLPERIDPTDNRVEVRKYEDGTIVHINPDGTAVVVPGTASMEVLQQLMHELRPGEDSE